MTRLDHFATASYTAMVANWDLLSPAKQTKCIKNWENQGYDTNLTIRQILAKIAYEDGLAMLQASRDAHARLHADEYGHLRIFNTK